MKKFFSEPRLTVKLFDEGNLIMMSLTNNEGFGGQGVYDPDAEWQD